MLANRATFTTSIQAGSLHLLTRDVRHSMLLSSSLTADRYTARTGAAMELAEAMRTTGTCRYFEDRQVPDDVLYTAFDHARFGPQGGNRQPVRWIVVRDPERKKALADLYLPPWKAYLAGIGVGDVRVGALPQTVVAA